MATKAELIESLERLPGFDGFVAEPRLEENGTNEVGDRRYRTNIRIIKNKKISFIDVYFYVIEEGLPTERAYVWERDPERIEDIVV